MATYTTSRTIIMTLLVGALLTPSVREAEAAALPTPVFTNETDAAAYEWTHDLFTAAGFEFPTAIVEFHRDDEACGGARGRTRFGAADETTTILVCATHHNPEVEDIWRQRTLLHELAHAWVDQNAGEEQTAAFMELRGTEVWSAREQAWQDRATEHAAEILMWGIQDGDYEVDFRIDDTGCGQLSAGYEVLTGVVVECDVPSA